MGIEGLDYHLIQIPLNAGLKTKDDPRAMQPPGLSICADARFDDLGGIQTRFPFTALGTNIFGGGTLSNVRRLAVNGTELVVFTDTAVYSWNAQLSVWVLRGTHLAVAVHEDPRFVTTDDQVDADRAELAGAVVYAWGVNSPKAVWVAALDKSTGSVLMAPTALSGTLSRPRLVALSTRIMLFVNDDTNTSLKAIAIDPASPATAVAGALTTVLATVSNFFYDVVKAGTQDLVVGACRRTTTTSYTAFTVTPGLVVAASTKARTADGPLAVATIADGTQTQVLRGNSTNVQGDLLTTSTLADVFTGQAIGTVSGTPINQIAAAFASTTCTAFWSSLETSDSLNSGFQVKSNTVTTSNVIGTEALFIRRLGVASRAFERGGQIYVWLVFGEDSAAVVAGTPLGVRAQLQNTYFLYRADKLVVSKATWQTAGGYSPSTGRLPGVVAIAANDYAWCGASRRVIDLSADNRTAFGARSPRDIVFSFDSNDARRCTTLGRTMYVSGGVVQQYDGFAIVEVGAFVYPWSIAAQDAAVGNLGAGTYNWKGTIAYVNGQGDKERSTTATGVQIAVGASRVVIISYFPLYVTNKTARPPSLEFWRTAAAAAASSPYYLITGQDPSVTTGDNPYIPNSTTSGATFNDNFVDATLTTKEINPENGGAIENLAPPGASIIVASADRLFLWGVPGDPHRISYSKLRANGEVAAFNDFLAVSVPPAGGDAAGLALLNETLIAFRRRAIYALAGEGFANDGSGQNYGPARQLSPDVGAVNPDAIALTDAGLLFKSDKGWYLVDKGWNVKYVGADVAKFDGDTVLAVHVVEAYHQVRCVTNGRILMFDYLTESWSAWAIADAVHACMWNGTYYYLSSSGNTPMQEQASFALPVNYGLDVELGFIKPADLQGAVRVAEILILGEYRGTCTVRIRTAYDYRQDGAGNWVYTDEVYWTPTPAVIGSVLQVSRGLSRGRCSALKIRITACSIAKDGTPPTTEAIKLTGIALRVGFRKTANKRLSAGQKV